MNYFDIINSLIIINLLIRDILDNYRVLIFFNKTLSRHFKSLLQQLTYNKILII